MWPFDQTIKSSSLELLFFVCFFALKNIEFYSCTHFLYVVSV